MIYAFSWRILRYNLIELTFSPHSIDTEKCLHNDSNKVSILNVLFFKKVNDQVIEIPQFSSTTKGALWENWSGDKVN